MTKKEESQYFDLRISKTIIEFAEALRRRYKQDLVACELSMQEIHNETQNLDPEEDESYYRMEGMHAGIRRCLDILNELSDAEVEDRKQFTVGESE